MEVNKKSGIAKSYDPPNDCLPNSLESYKSDVTDGSGDLPKLIRRIWVGTTGDVEVVFYSGRPKVYKNIASGTYIGPFVCKRIGAALTTATDLIGEV